MFGQSPTRPSVFLHRRVMRHKRPTFTLFIQSSRSATDHPRSADNTAADRPHQQNVPGAGFEPAPSCEEGGLMALSWCYSARLVRRMCSEMGSESGVSGEIRAVMPSAVKSCAPFVHLLRESPPHRRRLRSRSEDSARSCTGSAITARHASRKPRRVIEFAAPLSNPLTSNSGSSTGSSADSSASRATCATSARSTTSATSATSATADDEGEEEEDEAAEQEETMTMVCPLLATLCWRERCVDPGHGTSN